MPHETPSRILMKRMVKTKRERNKVTKGAHGKYHHTYKHQHKIKCDYMKTRN